MDLKKVITKHKVFIMLGCIILLSTFLRFYRLSDIYIFNFDEEYQATYAWTLVEDLHPIWIGVSASFLNFYLGPYFTYFTAFLLWLSKGDPIITAYFASFLGVITTIIVFLVGWKVFNLTTGVTASTLYASLPLFVFYDQKYWNTMFSNLITLLLFLTMLLIKKSKWFWLLYAVLLGIVLETHLMPLPLFLIGVFYFIKGKYFKDIKLLVACFLVFLLFYWPLIVFDYNHNFSNITFFTRFQNDLGQVKISFNPLAKFQTLFDSMGRFWYLKSGNPNADEVNFSCNPSTVKAEFKNVGQYTKRTYAPFLLSSLTLVLVFCFFYLSKKSKMPEFRLLSFFIAMALISFIVYPGGSSEYYTLSFLVLFVFVPGILISRVDEKIQLFLLILILIISVLGINTILKTSDEFGLGPKKVLISKVMNVVGEESFSIDGRGICHDYEGWRYLFKIYGKTPLQSYTDKNLGWLYPEEISEERSVYTVILVEDRIPLKEDLSKFLSIKSGGYRAYIRKN